jgi:uncharacterized membrane protein
MLNSIFVIVPISSVLALLFAYYFYKQMMKSPEGTEKMQTIAKHVRKGAFAYLKQQYKVVLIVFIILSAIFSFMAYVLKIQNGWVPVAFLTGGCFSALAGFFGMKAATSASAIVPVITLLFYCCTYSTELNRSLESAGSNRAELEAVLSHYRTADPNPYKLRAAEYLIENLPAHYSYAGTKIYDYYGYAARILADTALTPEQQRDSLLTITDSKYSDLPLHTIPDAEIITAVLDETPVGSRYTAATRWFVILSDRGMEETSEWDLSTMICGGFFPYERGPKVYRNSYAINKERQRYIERSRYRYPFDLGKKDVTKQYFLTSDLQLPIDRAYDGNLLSNFEINQPGGNWIGMDMGEPAVVTSVMVMPRSYDNDVYPRNEYELLYWNGNRWKSACYQKATENVLKYDIPINCPLWLRNYTRGRDERPFIIEDSGEFDW